MADEVKHIPSLELVPLASGCVASGEVLYADVGLSFWGGVDPLTGIVIDRTHPLFGQCIAGKVLAIPNGRGSSTGSQVMLELILNGVAPAALVLRQPDSILALGSVVADEVFEQSMPIVSVGELGFAAMAQHSYALICGRGRVLAGPTETAVSDFYENAAATGNNFEHDLHQSSSIEELLAASGLVLTANEQSVLDGHSGHALALAMRIVARTAAIEGAPSLLPVTQAHIDACTFIGPGGLQFAQRLASLGARVAVPTTLNATSVDRRQWQTLQVPPSLGLPATALGDAYLAMGCSSTSFTCAPYLLDDHAIEMGDRLAWGESNAVVYANSVLGARTQKCADYLDICAAITGRVPLSGAYLDEHRAATVVIDASALVQHDATSLLRDRVDAESQLIIDEEMGTGIVQECGDAFWPALGYLCGLVSEARVPVIVGLEKMASSHITRDDLKAFAGAFGSTASVPLFHMVGHTPEAPHVNNALTHKPPQDTVHLTPHDLAKVWVTLNSGAVPAPLSSSQRSSSRNYQPEHGNASQMSVVAMGRDACSYEASMLADEAAAAATTLSASEEKEAEVDVPIELVALGSPHLSLSECAAFASLLSSDKTPPLDGVNSPLTPAVIPAATSEEVLKTKKHPNVRVVATLGRQVLAQAESQGYASVLRNFGVELITDTCWCMLNEPVVPVHARTIVTNSAKYAHYAPSLVQRQVRFTDLRGCVQAAVTGRSPIYPTWVAHAWRTPPRGASFSGGISDGFIGGARSRPGIGHNGVGVSALGGGQLTRSMSTIASDVNRIRGLRTRHSGSFLATGLRAILRLK